MGPDGESAPPERNHMTTYKCPKCSQKITVFVKVSEPPRCAGPTHRLNPATMKVVVPAAQRAA